MTTSILPGAEPFSARGSQQGVLILHGFTSDPRAMRPLADSVANLGYSVELPRLPGHGTSVADLMTTGWTDWTTAAELAYDELAARCDEVAIVGLSMGGGLALYLAEKKSDLRALVVINPLTRPPGKEMTDGLQQLLDSGLETVGSIGSDIKKEGSKEASYEATPLACAQSLFAGVENVFEELGKVTAPTLVISSRDDHVVTSDNGDAVVENVSGPVERLWLENSFHVATLDNDAPLLESSTAAFLAANFSS